MTARRGFTLIEALVVLAIISLLALISVANMEAGREEAMKVDCDAYRTLVEQAEVALVGQAGHHSSSIGELLSTGLLTRIRHCRARGHYDWIPYPPTDHQFQRHYGCSVHDWPVGFGGPGAPALTPTQPGPQPTPQATPQATPNGTPQATPQATPQPSRQATPQPSLQPSSATGSGSGPTGVTPPQPSRPAWIPPGHGGTPPGHGGPHGPHDTGSGGGDDHGHGNHYGWSKH
jgi:prepilin-type N-terminal cleavage/methylation domain-containing protein